MVSDGSATYGYKNGSLIGTQGSGRSSSSSTGQNLLIGEEGNGNYTTSTIDDVRIYNTALTPQQVEKLYHKGAYRIPRESTLQ